MALQDGSHPGGRNGMARTHLRRSFGLALALGKLWKETGLPLASRVSFFQRHPGTAQEVIRGPAAIMEYPRPGQPTGLSGNHNRTTICSGTCCRLLQVFYAQPRSRYCPLALGVFIFVIS